ncbi:tRNA-His guanylyltransferase [Mucor velutinosus]|uniref:tRNA-His guanylyltransferase n=1 Tax=Mucor velutinosus TaxID=708070 RepID=A0AAN7DLW0_9FUNG|nr:tRNA-His guanylyltransferase [Mucor velutinosus]
MRKREQQQQPQPQPQVQPQQIVVGAPSFYMDIFEPPPQWRTSVNNNTNSINYHAHSPTHRSPIHHQPSLSEIVYQEFNGPSEIQEAYPGVYQQDRLSQQQHQLHHQRSQQFQQQQQQQQQQLQQLQLKQQLQYQLQQQHHQQTQEQNHHPHHHHSRANSIGSAHDFESAASSLHTMSTSPHYLQYDDVDDDNESIDKSMFHNHNQQQQQQQHRHQADNISIATSLFTAVEHLENDSEEEEHYDDNSSTENQRHGHLPSTTTFQEQKQQISINDLMKKLDIQTSVEWEDYKPQYRLLNESYDSVKQDIYKEIYATMQKLQELDRKFNTVKAIFHSTMEKNYEQMSNQLISQCDALTKEQNESKNKLKSDETNREYLPKSGKIRLNVGGSMFETSLSTLRRDTNSLLATMFSGRHLISAESDGSYFIDRDPSHFRLVLNYLRDLRIPPTILQDTKICQELLQEAKYYCIEGLIKILQQQHL